MAKELADAEMWQPSKIVYDDLVGDMKGKAWSSEAGFATACFPSEISFGLAASSPDSPVEKSMTETESDEEDYMAGLTRRMAHSFLHDDDNDDDEHNKDNKDIDTNAKPEAVAGSPQSTLCGWSVSNKTSPEGTSLLSSPRFSLVEEEPADQCNLLCEAAGQVMRLRLNYLEHRRDICDRGGVLEQPKKPAPAVSVPSLTTTAGYFTNTAALNMQQLRAAQFHHLKEQQFSAAWGGGQQNKIKSGDRGGGGASHHRPLGLPPSAWPPLQKAAPPQKPPPQRKLPQPCAGMRAVFLNRSGARKESAGTGVFFPRTAGSKTELRKKPACSTVLVPARVVQALNLNLEELGAQPQFPRGFVLNHDALISRSNNQKQNNQLGAQTAAMAASSDAHHLPQEWTY